MRKFNTFEPTGDGEFVVARPRNSTDEPVRLPADVVDRDEEAEEQGNWEEVISELTRHELGDTLAMREGGEAVISREEAAQALIDDENTFVRGELEAAALVEYLAEEDILELEENEVVVLKPFNEIYDSKQTKMLNNWAATLDTCIDRIDHAVERVESAKERLEDRQQNTTSTVETRQDIEEEKDEIKQEIEALLAGRDPSELDDEEYTRFEQLRKRYHLRESMEESVGIDITDTSSKAQQLGDLISDFQILRDTLAKHSDDFRRASLTESVFPEGAVEQLDNFTEMVTALTGALSPEKKMEQQSDDEFLEDVLGSGELETATEKGAEIEESDTEPLVDQQA